MTKATSVALIAALLAIGACSSDEPDAGTPATEAAASVEETSAADTTAAPVEPNGVVVDVLSIDNTFRPETIEITAGTEVRWTNNGRNEHNVLPVEGDDWGVQTEDFAPKDVYSHVFTTPGTYAYYCSIHGTTEVGMIGTVVVTG